MSGDGQTGVGHHNQGHFIRFLIYVDLATSYHLIMMGRRVYDMTAWTSVSSSVGRLTPTVGDTGVDNHVPASQPEPSTFQLVLVIINLATCVPVWMMVGVFSIYHVYCAAGNSTTIEGWEKDRVATMVRRGKIREVKYPYVSALRISLRFTRVATLISRYLVTEPRTGKEHQVRIGKQPAPLALASKSSERWTLLPRLQGGSW